MTFNEIDDTEFSCLAANIGGVLVPEHVEMVECCQDADNLNLIYLKLTLAGVYDYTPVLKVNGIDMSAYFVPGYKGIGVSEFPIRPACGSITITLAYMIGHAIQDYQTINDLNIEIQFFGQLGDLNFSQLIQESGVFQSSNPSASVTLHKGLTPKPYKLYFDPNTNQLKIQYSSLGDKPCLCAINCVNPTEDDFNLTICEDEIQELSVNANSIIGDPTNVSILFQDSLGNQTEVQVHALANVTPVPPSVMLKSDPTHITIGVFHLTTNKAIIKKDKTKYQVLKYENNPDNFTILKDWTSKPWNMIYDRNIRSGRKYGYAVRFKGEFEELSNQSAWSEIEVS